MIERNIYLQIVDLYKKENNLNRLVFRLIKYETGNLSFEQIVNRVTKIVYSKLEIEHFHQQTQILIEQSRNKMKEHLKSLKCEDITSNGHNFSYSRNGNYYSTSNLSYENEIIKSRNAIYREKYIDPIENALNTIIEFDYVESYLETNYYPTSRNKVKSKITRYKSKK